ncbi:MAG: hypothetical protein K9J83_03615 [Desulfarculaceae bacterium]|nr:hypothetical protein [Desulfarculaceae bacterium]
MNILYKTIPVTDDTVPNTDRVGKLPNRSASAYSRRRRKERRKKKYDRRQSVRTGVIVSLSYQNDRRKGGDRRKNQA